ncbi:MOSC domain-containing protein [Piscinibacterium candidicorallinum]|uniref:MOSC domain-containing protein n=1 Tax=Piscinibacterium candidicorallinum TaxID=1793872 RepID=A0ABV7HDB7_9BURK
MTEAAALAHPHAAADADGQGGAAPGVARVESVAAHGSHAFSKTVQAGIELLVGLGVAGDVHAGVTVKHRSRVAKDPTQPNLRQVHLIHAELLDHLAAQGFTVRPGDLGENLLTRGIDLLGLPTDAELQIGPVARIRITGLRNPCAQIDRFAPGLMSALLDRAADGSLIRKGGVMAVVLACGPVRAGDAITIHLAPGEHRPLAPV